MVIYDAHSHLSFLRDHEVSEYLKICQKTILASYNLDDAKKQLELEAKYTNQIKASIGLHPWYIHDLNEKDLYLEIEKIEKNISKYSWLGELGIDRGNKHKNTIERQKKIFPILLDLANSHNKKIILHVVKSEEDVLFFLKEKSYQGIVHSFRGTYIQAKRFIDKGLFLSFGPNILNKKSDNFVQALQKIPLSSILIESDYPSQTKDRFILSKVAQELARIRNTEVELIVESANNNFLNLFKG